VRILDVEYQLPNNAFVKQVPNKKYYRLIEHTDTMIKFATINKQKGVPYCETFGVDEMFIIAGPDKPNAQCCVVITGYIVNWYKSTMMKKVITSQITSENKVGNERYRAWM